jgi:hypothetical protein
MRISDFSCHSCASVYQVAESSSAEGSPGQAECAVCGKLLESWEKPQLKAYRLVIPLEQKFKFIAVPPSPDPITIDYRGI